MAERQTLLTSGPTGSLPLQGPRTDARGTFGDASGLVNLGRGVAAAGGDLAQGAADYVSKLAHRRNERDANDFQARLQLALNEQTTGLNADLSDAITNQGLTHLELEAHMGKQAAERLKNVGKSISELRPRNPDLFDRMITPEVVASAWSGRADNVQSSVIQFNAELTQGERFETALKNDQFAFTKHSNSPETVTTLADNITASMEKTAHLYTVQQRTARRNAINRSVHDVLMSAAIDGREAAVAGAEEALQKGYLAPDDRSRIIAEFRRVTDPKVVKPELRNTAVELNNNIRGGDNVSSAVVDEANANAAATYTTPENQFSEVIKPLIMANLEGELKAGLGKGALVGGSYANAASLLEDLSNPESPIAKKLFEDSFGYARARAADTYSNLSRYIYKTGKMMPSDKDFAAYKELLVSSLKRQKDMVDNYRVHELYQNHPAIIKAAHSGDIAALVRTQDSLYDRDGIPENRRVYGDPKEISALQLQMQNTDEASISKTSAMVDSFVNKMGKDGYAALISLARSPSAIAGVVNFQARQFMATNEKAANDIRSVLPELNAAVAWANSAEAKTVMEKNTEFKKQTQQFWNAALSTGWQGDFDSKSAFGAYLNGDLHVAPESSPLGQAAIREGTYAGLSDLGLALTMYYTAGKKDQLMPANQAAAQARAVISRAFIPVASNGGGADKETIYTFAPVTNNQTTWYTPGAKGAFNSQRHYSQMEEAAWDSMFLTENPKFAVGGKIQWQFNLALTHALNGPRAGFNTELAQMPNLDPAFSAVARSTRRTTAFNTSPIDFANLGVLMPDPATGTDKFVPLSEDRIVTDFLPVTVRERVRALLDSTDKTDVRGRNQLVLANNFQREPNARTSSWDVYISGGRDYAGNAGTLSKSGPRASVVVKQADGTYKKLSIPFVESDNRLEAMMAASSFFNRAGSNNQVRKELLAKQPQPKKN